MKRFGDPARLALLLASVCAAPFAFSAPAAAQDDVAEEEEVITVTARRRAESLQDVPIAISVQTAEQLDQRGAENLTVLQQTTPNATVQVARGSNSTLIAFIRITSTSAFSPTAWQSFGPRGPTDSSRSDRARAARSRS